jgi:hypothetical protein
VLVIELSELPSVLLRYTNRARWRDHAGQLDLFEIEACIQSIHFSDTKQAMKLS